MTWLSEIEKTYGTIEEHNRAFGEVQLVRRMARVIREQSAILRVTNPWKVGIATPDDYICRYCRIHVRFTCPPKGMEFLEEHEKDCIWRNLSPDAKELINDPSAPSST